MPAKATREDFAFDYVFGAPRVQTSGARLPMIAMIVVLLVAVAAILPGRAGGDDAPATDAADIMQGP